MKDQTTIVRVIKSNRLSMDNRMWLQEYPNAFSDIVDITSGTYIFKTNEDNPIRSLATFSSIECPKPHIAQPLVTNVTIWALGAWIITTISQQQTLHSPKETTVLLLLLFTIVMVLNYIRQVRNVYIENRVRFNSTRSHLCSVYISEKARPKKRKVVYEQTNHCS